MSRWQQQFCDVRQTWELSQGWGDLVPRVPLWALQGWWELPLQREVVSPCTFIPLFFFLLLPTLLHCTGPGRFLRPAQLPRYLLFASFAFHNLDFFFSITGVDFNLNY